MKPTSNKALPCAVFGHNFVKTRTLQDHTAELTCTHCNIAVRTDISGNFEEISISNKNIQTALRKLFHLRLQTAKPKFS
ncbi:MAG: hypothetical protein KDD26_08900 [Winogradskyella sp.]|nr:hypothetical protein [Winogradskyella sp.]